MSDKQRNAHRPNKARPDTSIDKESLSAQGAEDPRQKMRSALLEYARHLAKDVDPPKTRADVYDVMTLISLCKQAFDSDKMLASLQPELLPLLKEKLLPSVKYRERDKPTSALAHLSDHPLWYQEMVSLGYADEVSAPNKFKKYDDFIKAIKAIDDGHWTFQYEQIYAITGQNYEFTVNFQEDAHREIYLRLCEKYRRRQEELSREYRHYDD